MRSGSAADKRPSSVQDVAACGAKEETAHEYVAEVLLSAHLFTENLSL